AVNDATDSVTLSKLLAAIATEPEPRSAVGARGRAFACALQDEIPFPDALEKILADAAARRRVAPSRKRSGSGAGETAGDRFRLTKLASVALANAGVGVDLGLTDSLISESLLSEEIDLPRAREILDVIRRAAARERERFRSLLAAVQTEIAIAT